MKKTFFFNLLGLLCFVGTFAQDYDIIVAKDSTGKFTSIQEAILSVRDYRPEGRTRIFIKKGVYEEKIVCPSWKTNISLIGEDKDSTIIIWNDHANINKMGTFRTYTLKVEGPGFQAENLTIQNNAPQKGQAVALHVEADKAVFRNCRLLGFQDTVFTGNEFSRQYYENCYIEGTVDFIFGPATAWFENCQINSKRTKSYVTAASTPGTKKYGYVFNNCHLTADEGVKDVFLGRPWRCFSAVIFMNCKMDSHINPRGWDNWRNPDNEKTARYTEYNNSGEGADQSQRVDWTRKLTGEQAAEVTLENVFQGSAQWDPHGDNTGTMLPNNNAAINGGRSLPFRDVIAPFMGRPYVAGTLETDSQEQLIIDTERVDCSTFVEYVAAARLSAEMPDSANGIYRRMLTSLRYRNSKVDGYASRIHYFSEWIESNIKKGYIKDVTSEFENQPLKINVNFMSTHPSSYRQLKGNPDLVKAIRETEENINTMFACYIPKDKVKAQISKIKEGDIIAITTNIEGLDISHVGFAYNKDGMIHLLHASADKKKVIIDAKPLDEYLKSNKKQTGIRVLRLNR